MKKAKKIKKLKGVKLWFDNGEYCFIPVEHIKKMQVEEFSKGLEYSEEYGLGEYLTCTLQFLEISNEFLKDNYPRINEECINEKVKLLDRLNKQDVLKISFIYLNSKSKEFIVPWMVNEDGTNMCQAFSCTDINTSILSIREQPFVFE